MFDENEVRGPEPLDWSDFFGGLLSAAAFNALMIKLFLMVFGLKDANEVIGFIFGMIVLNAIVATKLPKTMRSFARGWSLMLPIIGIPLLLGVCIGL
ncbi:MAG: hypothetical protein GY765_30850 [bacterium]|nr:hypothetical protein [bacterium]